MSLLIAAILAVNVHSTEVELNRVDGTPFVVQTEKAECRNSLGLFTITAYCPCEVCCGEYAVNRPINEKGQPLVYGSGGDLLVAGLSVAADLPVGTQLFIDGFGNVVVQDRPADFVIERYDGKIIDIYFSTHEEALNFGKTQMEVFQVDK